MGEVVLGISGASGAIYGVRLAHALNDLGVKIRLVVSDSGRITLKHECDTTPEELAKKLAMPLEKVRKVLKNSSEISFAQSLSAWISVIWPVWYGTP